MNQVLTKKETLPLALKIVNQCDEDITTYLFRTGSILFGAANGAEAIYASAAILKALMEEYPPDVRHSIASVVYHLSLGNITFEDIIEENVKTFLRGMGFN